MKDRLPWFTAGGVCVAALVLLMGFLTPYPATTYRKNKDYVELTYEGRVYYEVGIKKWRWVSADGQSVNWDYNYGRCHSGSNLTAAYQALLAKQSFMKVEHE